MFDIIINLVQSFLSDFFFTYSTVKEIQIRSKVVGSIHRFIQFSILIGIVLYIILIEKGYQKFQAPQGSSIIKIKGPARISARSSNFDPVDTKRALWDAAEYVIPPMESNAFFIATRKIITYGQTEGICPSALKEKLFCNSTYNPCKQGMPTPNGFGLFTGNCVPSQENTTINVCEINAWCPEEMSNSTDRQINTDDLSNITVFIKTGVVFSDFDIKLRTVKQSTNFSCRFDTSTNSHCPIFQIGYIIKNLAEQSSTANVNALYKNGGLIQIEQTWKCNFDYKIETEECFPTYTFNLLQSGDDKVSPGINYRFVEKYLQDGKEYRTITKLHGLRFIVTTTGQGGRLDMLQLFLAIGSGIGYMIIAEFVAEFLLMRLHRQRDVFRQNKVKICSLSNRERTNTMTAPDIVLTLPNERRLSFLRLIDAMFPQETTTRTTTTTTYPHQIV